MPYHDPNEKWKPGRPTVYDSAEAMQEAIDEYFDHGMATRTYVVGKGDKAYEVEVKVPTITGLILYLGYCSRSAFYTLEENDKFSDTVKRARLRVENVYEENLQLAGINPTGSIFALKNMGWRDDRGVELTGNANRPIILADERLKDV